MIIVIIKDKRGQGFTFDITYYDAEIHPLFDVWNYYIGGYQVLQKYLKDRKGIILKDAPHYCRIVTALQKTIETQKEIDNLYPEIGKALIQF